MLTRDMKGIGRLVKVVACLVALMTTISVSAQDALSAEEIQELRRLLEKQSNSSRLMDASVASIVEPLTIGGYGDLHANIKQDSEDTGQVDIHRFVVMLNYEFSKHIKLFTEVELEHAWSDDGYVLLEQFYIDFGVTDNTSILAGRLLVPLGIINAHHEPTLFNGVERPDVDKYLIPSTWTMDGIGIASTLSNAVTAKVYLGGGMDGSGFSSDEGFRGGRIKGRPSLREPMVAGRVDWRIFESTDPDFANELRIGLSGAYGGVDNTNKGGTNDLNGEFTILSGDYDYRVGALALRGEFVHTYLSNAAEIGASLTVPDTIATEMYGWYQEVAFHYMPESWEGGRLDMTDANVFVRYEEFDTQYKMPSGVAANGAGIRDTWTLGAQWWFTRNLVVKVDYQIRNDKDAGDLDDLINLGIGLVF